MLTEKDKPIPNHSIETAKPAGWWRRYLARHQHPVCRLLHAVGVPLLAAALPLALVQLARGQWHLWWRPVGLLAISYLLQWVGHRIEGNDMGEIILIKKLLGRPFVAVGPRYQPTDAAYSNAPATPGVGCPDTPSTSREPLDT